MVRRSSWHAADMPDDETPSTLTIIVAPALQPLMFGKRRAERVRLHDDGVSTIGHLIGSLGIPLTEIGAITLSEAVGDRVGDRVVGPEWRALPGAIVSVRPRPRPQPTATQPPRFVLDVHLGTLARRLRLLGIDAAWRHDATDTDLIAQALEEGRVVLTRDRGLLLRRAARNGAYVRGNNPDDQLADVLDRFTPPLAPWTRCPTCNARLQHVEKSEIVDLIQPGTKRNYNEFAQCPACGRVFWQGAHHNRLQRIVAKATGR